MAKKPSEKYPLIWAWGYMLGSHEDYMDFESLAAERDNAPADVIYRSEFTHISPSERERALEREREGTALIIRDRRGEPIRAWFMFGGVTRQDTRERVERIAGRLRDGLSPWS